MISNVSNIASLLSLLSSSTLCSTLLDSTRGSVPSKKTSNKRLIVRRWICNFGHPVLLHTFNYRCCSLVILGPCVKTNEHKVQLSCAASLSVQIARFMSICHGYF